MPETPHRPKNWLLIKIRDYHTWLGVVLSVFVVALCLTGIYLNHKEFFHGGEKKPEPRAAAAAPLKTSTELAAVGLTPQQALTQARETWGDTTLERLELKDEHGRLVYKIKAADEGGELILDAGTGAVVQKKEGYKKAGALDWGKVMKDLHTGKIGGTGGKLFVDFTSLVIIVLTVTGVYLWAVPLYRKRQSARARNAAAAKTPAAEPVAAGV